MPNELNKPSNIDINLDEILKNAKNSHEFKTPIIQQTNGQCGLINFEGVGDFQPIPLYSLGFTTVIFDNNWRSLLDSESGGSGDNIGNLPSPHTVGYLYFASSGDIYLTNPVSSVSLYYASSVNVTLEAYDSNGALLSSASGSANTQPTSPSYSKWDQLKITLESNVISKIRINGLLQFTVIDDIELCLAPIRGFNFF